MHLLPHLRPERDRQSDIVSNENGHRFRVLRGKNRWCTGSKVGEYVFNVGDVPENQCQRYPSARKTFLPYARSDRYQRKADRSE
jgi:hypothetical protein